MEGSKAERTESVWLCPDCGLPNNHSHCDECLRPRPFQSRKLFGWNETGSPGYDRVIHPESKENLQSRVVKYTVWILISLFVFQLVLRLLIHWSFMNHPVNGEASKFGPWFCPYCGFHNSGLNCDACFSPRPFEMPLHNPATSIFSSCYGPIGFWGLPQYLAILLLLTDVSGFLGKVLRESEIGQIYATERLHK